VNIAVEFTGAVTLVLFTGDVTFEVVLVVGTTIGVV
jgi:hypothetical protein